MYKNRKVAVIAVVVLAAGFILFKLAGNTNRTSVETKIFRPITTLRLKEINPNRELMLTGVVKCWKEEDISFEVSGRVEWVIEKGSEVGGPGLDYDEPGTVVARLDPVRYQLKLKSIKAQIVAAEASAEALKVSIKEVMSRQLEAAQADLVNTESRYKRLKTLLERKAASQQDFDDAEANYKVAQAKKAETKAGILSKKAEYKALLAQVEELKHNAAEAELNLEKCVLRSPFQGRVAKVTANIGANVQSGTEVAHLVMMNPILVSLNVAPNVDRSLKFHDIVNVYPSGMEMSVKAMVNRKNTVADSYTHTFDLELFVQNYQVPVCGKIPASLKKYPEIKGLWRCIRLSEGRMFGRIVVSTDAISRDEKGEFVWLAEKSSASVRGVDVCKLKKLHVKFEPKVHNILNLYSFKILDKQETKPKPGAWLAYGVPAGIKNGDMVLDVTRRWLFRPGDLAKVLLKKTIVAHGIFVPIEAIVHENNNDYVYLVTYRHGDNRATLEKIKVKLGDNVGSFQRIESDRLKPGNEIVLKGVHYLEPGDEVTVRKVEDIRL